MLRTIERGRHVTVTRRRCWWQRLHTGIIAR